jgi:hypothetical protein
MQGAFDRASGDFASFDLSVAEPLLCQGERAGNNACVAWAYMQAFGNRGRPHCWLKNSSPAAVVNLDVTSGAKSAAPPTIGDIWEFTGRRAMATIAGAGDGSITIQRPPKSLLVTLDFISFTMMAGSGAIRARLATATIVPDGSGSMITPRLSLSLREEATFISFTTMAGSGAIPAPRATGTTASDGGGSTKTPRLSPSRQLAPTSVSFATTAGSGAIRERHATATTALDGNAWMTTY